MLADELPFQVRGFAVNFRAFEGADARLGNLGHMHHSTERPLNHGVMINAVRPYTWWYLGVDPPSIAVATEAYAPNIQRVRDRLGPMGVTVI